MPLNKDVLGAAIASAVAALNENQKTDLPTIWKAIAEQVILHIQSAGVVTVTVPSGIPVATAGSAVAQTGATTAPAVGTGTIA